MFFCCCCFFISKKYFFNNYRWCFQSSERTEEIYKLQRKGDVFVVVVVLFWKIFFQWIIIDHVFKVQRKSKKYINYGGREIFCYCYCCCCFISKNIFSMDSYRSCLQSPERTEKIYKLWGRECFVVVVVVLFWKIFFQRIVIDCIFRENRRNI